ncbi:MAG: LysR family transcriptional regulator [Rhizobiales bacterium]|nr:LysR family transcriptional regulator [Hyphomicrobiales bacterium]
MNLRTLTYFAAVVEEGSISRAALRLRVAQPALSLHILNLERELDTELLHRTARGVTMTESGTRLYQHARDILARIDLAREDVRGHAASAVGEVVLAMTQSIAKVLALPVFQRVVSELPRVSFRLSESNTGHIPTLLRQRQIDLGITFKAQRDPAIHEEPLVEEDLYLIGPADKGGNTDEGNVTLDAVARLPLILPGRPHSLRELINDYARKNGLALNVVGEVDAVPQLKDFVAAGMGHTILTQASVQAELGDGSLSARRIVEPVISRRVILCRSAEIPPTRATVAVQALLIETARHLVDEKRWPGRFVGTHNKAL